MNPLERLQNDTEHCLLSMHLLRYVTITAVRPRTSGEVLNIQTKINNTLAGLSVRNGKRGCAVIVGMPELRDVNPNLRNVKGDLVLVLSVIENPIINEGADGTGFTAESLAWLLATTLPQTNLAPGGQIIADKELVTPMPEAVMEKRIEYRVTLRMLSHSDAVEKVATPGVSLADNTLTLSCATSGAAIYVTFDGSYPGPGNPAAEIYTVPITDPTGTLRAAAHHEAMASSDVVARVLV
jgi:hypothetical protein